MDVVKRVAEIESKVTDALKLTDNRKMQLFINDQKHLTIRFYESDDNELRLAKLDSVCARCGMPIHVYGDTRVSVAKWVHESKGSPLGNEFCHPDDKDHTVAVPNEHIPTRKLIDTMLVFDSYETQKLVDFLSTVKLR